MPLTMKKTFAALLVAFLIISCEDQVSEHYPLWTPSLVAWRGDGTLTLQWYRPMWLFIKCMSVPASEPWAFEVYVAEGSPDHFEKIATVENNGNYSFTLNNVENGTSYFAEIRATAYLTERVTSNRVMAIPGENEQVVRLEAEGNPSMESGSMAGDAGTLAYMDRNFTWNNGQYGATALYVLDLNSHTSSIVDTAAYFPDWSPVDPKLVFCTDKHESSAAGYLPQQIAVYDASEGTITPLTTGNDFNSNPEFSPDGNWVAYSSDYGHHGTFEIWKMAADGSQKTQVSENLQLAGLNFGNLGLGRPVWSPDGEYIYFNRYFQEETDMDIYRISAGGGEAEPVIQSPWRDFIPAVSPDHSKIAFVSERSGRNQIWVYEPASDRYRQVTGDGRFDVQTYWGKLEWIDGNTILFTGYETGTNSQNGIFTVDLEP
jgi:Tol biopolymer transport system component